MTHFKKPSVQNVHIQVLILAGIEFQVARKSVCVDHLPSLRMQEKEDFSEAQMSMAVHPLRLLLFSYFPHIDFLTSVSSIVTCTDN